MTASEDARPQIEALLLSATGVSAAIVDVEQLAHARGSVTRVTLDRALDGIGSTVIVKWRDPDNWVGAFASTNLRTEFAALTALDGSGADVAPRVIAGGDADGMLVLTDVGGSSVEAVIHGDDDSAARAALLALARTTARLHTSGHDPATFSGLDTWTIATRDSGWDALNDAIVELRFPEVTTAAAAEHESLLADLRSPGDAIALVHGDLGPNNAVLDGQGDCRLVDFEGAGHQHIGLDAAMLRFPFAWYGQWAPMPGDVQTAMESAYRETLGWPREDIDACIAVGCMAIAVLRLERLPRIAATDQSADMSLRRKSQMVATIDVAVAAARDAERYPALATWLEDMADAMRVRWTEATESLPVYVAFRQPSLRLVDADE